MERTDLSPAPCLDSRTHRAAIARRESVEHMDFGKALRTVRAARRLSQKDVAELASLDPSYISLIEAGRRKPTLTMAEELARALDVPVYLFMLLGSEEQDLRGIAPAQASILGRQILDLALATHRGGSGRGRKRPRNDAAARGPRRRQPRRASRTRRKG